MSDSGSVAPGSSPGFPDIFSICFNLFGVGVKSISYVFIDGLVVFSVVIQSDVEENKKYDFQKKLHKELIQRIYFYHSFVENVKIIVDYKKNDF